MSKQLVENIKECQECYRGIDWDEYESDEAEHIARLGWELIQQLAREVALRAERRGELPS